MTTDEPLIMIVFVHQQAADKWNKYIWLKTYRKKNNLTNRKDTYQSNYSQQVTTICNELWFKFGGSINKCDTRQIKV